MPHIVLIEVIDVDADIDADTAVMAIKYGFQQLHDIAASVPATCVSASVFINEPAAEIERKWCPR